MPKLNITLDAILEKLDKGERLGIDEALGFLAASRQFLNRDAEEKFFDAARRAAKKNPPPLALDGEYITTANKTPSDIALAAKNSPKSLVILMVSDEDALESVEQVVQAASAHKSVVALSPDAVLRLASSSGLKVTETVRRLALAGLGIVSGKLSAKGSDDAAIDEYFGVIMQLHKFKIKTSVWLPTSFSDTEKVMHLAKLREFEDRTRCFTHFFLHINSKPSDKDLLRTVALSRLMLDNIKRISLVDYAMSQPRLTDALLQQCVELGVNITEQA